jgi:hypothetical protein
VGSPVNAGNAGVGGDGQHPAQREQTFRPCLKIYVGSTLFIRFDQLVAEGSVNIGFALQFHERKAIA